MNSLLASAPILLLVMSLAFEPARPQGTTRPLSPRDSVFYRIDTNVISVNYGRPSMRGRPIMGELVPWNTVWRTGANQATHFKTNFDMKLGDVTVPSGTYTLWTLPSQTGWKIILNKQTGQWGTSYDPRQDYARFDASVDRLEAPVETLTVAFEETGTTKGRMKIMWEKTMVWTEFEKRDDIRPVSPLDSTEVLLDKNLVRIKYSRPYKRGREIWGNVVPYDSVWRTGANFATELHTQGSLAIGGVQVPAGTYTIYSKPSEKDFTLIINKKGPGFAEYDASLNLAQVAMTMKKIERSVDPFAIRLEPSDKKNVAHLKLSWDGREYAVDVVAK